MIVKPKVRGFICTTAHPLGCKQNVKNQIDYIKSKGKSEGAKKVLVIGASTGYGLASRITSAFLNDAATIGVIFDKEATEKRTATAGWYNTAAFHQFAKEENLYAKTINGDAFSKEIKKETIDLIKKDLGKIDLLIYSLAAPRREDENGNKYSSTLKTVGESYTNKTIDLSTKKITEITIPPATEEEVQNTIKVMGGEDWKDWVTALKEADALTEDFTTVAYSYIGPALTHPIYLNGTIGKAKEHLYNTAKEISDEFNVKGYVSVNKALVTQSSAAIPIVPLYISILYKIMKEENVHEGCIEQLYRLYHDKLFHNPTILDNKGYLRVDDLEMEDKIQNKINDVWSKVNDENLLQYADIDGYWDDFYKMFGFNMDGIDYDVDVETTSHLS